MERSQSPEVKVQVQSHIDGKVDPDLSRKKIYKFEEFKIEPER